MKIKVFLLDDHEVVRLGVRQLLEAEADIEVVGEAATAAQAVNVWSWLMKNAELSALSSSRLPHKRSYGKSTSR